MAAPASARAPKPAAKAAASENQLQDAFLSRAMTALRRVSETAGPQALASALAAPTDVGSITRLLSQAGVVGPAVEQLDPLATAVARNVDHRRELARQAGGFLSAGQAAQLLQVSRQAIDKRRKSLGLVAVQEGSDWKYPACQFKDGSVVPGIGMVVKGMARQGPWPTLEFLLAPDSVLGGRSPLQALVTGDIEEVERLVHASGEDGFA